MGAFVFPKYKCTLLACGREYLGGLAFGLIPRP